LQTDADTYSIAIGHYYTENARIMKRFRALFAVLLLGMLCAGMSQLPAGASTASAQKAAAVAVPAVTNCPVVPGSFSIYNSNCSGRHNYGCSSGNQNTLAYPPLYVSNGCPYRVWIYQGPGKTGYSLCITNGTPTNRLGRVYDYFWVSSNHNAC